MPRGQREELSPRRRTKRRGEAASAQAPLQLDQRRRQHEDAHRLGIGRADLARALVVDVEDDSAAFGVGLGALDLADDIAERAACCRFRDCRHESEPGCAVRGHVSDERLGNWNKLLREARRDTLTARERKAQVSVWKARGRAAKVRMAIKRGE